jgi:hypothetical protein
MMMMIVYIVIALVVLGAIAAVVLFVVLKKADDATTTTVANPGVQATNFYIESKVSLAGVTASQFTATAQVAFRQTIAAGMNTTKEKVHVHSEIGWKGRGEGSGGG